MVISCAIVDDNKLARMALKQMTSNINQLEIIAECNSALELINLLDEKKIDLVFLDIEMPNLSGLEFVKQQKHNKPYIIFTTGKAEYAIDAFETNVIDYLLKPVEMNRLLIAVNKVKELMSNSIATPSSANIDYFFVKDKLTFKKVQMSNVLFFEAMGDYVKIHTQDKVYMVHSTLKTIEAKLNTDLFMRVHRSYIIALDKIDSIEDGAININKNGVPIADAYRTALNKKLNFM